MDPFLVGQLTVVSCTGMICPSVGAHLIKNVHLSPWIANTPVIGAGCQGAGPGLSRAFDYVNLRRSEVALVVAVEISNACYHPNPDNDLGVYLGNALFGDGAAAVLVEGIGRGFLILNSISYTDADHIDKIGLDWVDARLKLRLSTNTPNLVAPLMRKVVDRSLHQMGISQDRIKFWVVHSGGASILKQSEEELGIPHDQLKFSWSTWENYGNMSSPTVLYALEELMYSGELQWGDLVMMVTAGAGVEVGATLMRWTG